MVQFTMMGIPCVGLNGGPAFQHNEAHELRGPATTLSGSAPSTVER